MVGSHAKRGVLLMHSLRANVSVVFFSRMRSCKYHWFLVKHVTIRLIFGEISVVINLVFDLRFDSSIALANIRLRQSLFLAITIHEACFILILRHNSLVVLLRAGTSSVSIRPEGLHLRIFLSMAPLLTVFSPNPNTLTRVTLTNHITLCNLLMGRLVHHTLDLLNVTVLTSETWLARWAPTARTRGTKVHNHTLRSLVMDLIPATLIAHRLPLVLIPSAIVFPSPNTNAFFNLTFVATHHF